MRRRVEASCVRRWALWCLPMLFAAGCASLPQDVERPVTHVYSDTDRTLLGRLSSDVLADASGQSAFHLLTSGLDAFVARAVLANVAERSIDVQYYLLHGDLTGMLFVDQLLKAADRGVRVRLLVDDMDLGGRDLGAAVLDSHPNVEVRLFNPFSRKSSRLTQLVTRFGSVTRRMHNKSFTVDNKATILGGRNIGNEYFDADPNLAFNDTDVLLLGPVVEEVSSSFDRYWNSELSYPAISLLGRTPTEEEVSEKRAALDEFVAAQQDSVYLDALRSADFSRRIRSEGLRFEMGEAHVVYDEPEKITADRDRTEYHLAPQIAQYFHDVDSELIIFSPYFVPGKEGTAFLGDLSESGVNVRIVTNSLASTDVPIVHSGYARYRKKLLRAGVKLYEVKPAPDKDTKRGNKHWVGSSQASLHSKVFIFDRNHLFIGSLNLDPRSVKENTEIGVVIRSREVATEVVDSINQRLSKHVYRLVLETGDDGIERMVWIDEGADAVESFSVEPDTSLMQRMGVAFFSLFPIESQL